MFAYCENDPVNREDQSGELFSEIVGGAIAGALIGAASTLINAKIDGKQISCMDVVTGALRGALSGGIAAGFAFGGVFLKVAGVAINGGMAALSAAANGGNGFDIASSACSAMAATAIGYLYPALGSGESALLRTVYTGASGLVVGGITESGSSSIRAVTSARQKNSHSRSSASRKRHTYGKRARRIIDENTRQPW